MAIEGLRSGDFTLNEHFLILGVTDVLQILSSSNPPHPNILHSQATNLSVFPPENNTTKQQRG